MEVSAATSSQSVCCQPKKIRAPVNIGDRTTSNVVVRLRTPEGRDSWFYCHSLILEEKSKYFADRLSNHWPTYQILDSRHCVEVYCDDLDINFYVNTLRLFYATELNALHGVRNVLGILQVSIRLGCDEIADACVDYLEAVPWEEAEEEEILKTVPGLGPLYASILSRIQPVNPNAVVELFTSTVRFATSSPPTPMHDMKSSAQEQLEYVLTEDDDAPLLTTSYKFKSEVRSCTNNLLCRFSDLLSSLLPLRLNTTLEMSCEIRKVKSFLLDLSWACQVLTKMEMLKEFVHSWVGISDDLINALDMMKENKGLLEVNMKVVEVVAKVLEAIGYGNVILSAPKRLHMVKVWLPFMQKAKASLDDVDENSENELVLRTDSETWQALEASFASIILALPSVNQADILAEWLKSKHIGYPDLSEAFELWCYRSKVARKKLAFLG